VVNGSTNINNNKLVFTYCNYYWVIKSTPNIIYDKMRPSTHETNKTPSPPSNEVAYDSNNNKNLGKFVVVACFSMFVGIVVGANLFGQNNNYTTDDMLVSLCGSVTRSGNSDTVIVPEPKVVVASVPTTSPPPTTTTTQTMAKPTTSSSTDIDSKSSPRDDHPLEASSNSPTVPTSNPESSSLCPYAKYPEYMFHKDVKAEPYPSIGNRIYVPHMEPEELAFFDHTLGLSQYKHYFEFGMGGSTGLASTKKNLLTITTVDTDMRFAATLRDYALGDQVKGYWVNIGPVGEWGGPKPETSDSPCHSYWPRFALSYGKLHQTGTNLVFVDGRFRSTCVLAVLLTGDRPDFLIHDYFGDGREGYHIVEEFLDRDKCAKSLCHFVPKKNIDPVKVQALYEQKKYDVARR
jgi:hypothetical protein